MTKILRYAELDVKPVIQNRFAPRNWRLRANPSATGTRIHYCIYRLLRFPLEREYTGRISALMALQSTWISREVGFPNFRSHRAKSRRIFALATDFGVEWSACECLALNAHTVS
ncbi:hypothetical protein AVEN_228376-1 [Araneus ventricosus]|uniref:Uncharacterized protein n=1 Tax=Araneus ventricosus TaxID=182803 RepID=A0A4Y2LIC3_ARAVE|nr:hypothetical protein AVEN_228376-1 [Araneus ventricosus]